MEGLLIRRTLELDCPVDELWRLVSDPDEIASWLGRDVVLDLRPGGRGRLTDDDGTVRHLAIDGVVDGEHLCFRWWPEEDEQAASTVVFAIEPAERGSRLIITETAAASALTSTASATSWDLRVLSLWLSVCALARV
jgi:uncharacterized protein YndB with AHSA1/START domain